MKYEDKDPSFYSSLKQSFSPLMQIWQHSVNRKDLQALTIVGTPRNNLEPDTLAELRLDHWLYFIMFCCRVFVPVRLTRVYIRIHADTAGSVFLQILAHCAIVKTLTLQASSVKKVIQIYSSLHPNYGANPIQLFLQMAILHSCPRPLKITLSTSNLDFSYLKGVPLLFVWIKNLKLSFE